MLFWRWVGARVGALRRARWSWPLIVPVQRRSRVPRGKRRLPSLFTGGEFGRSRSVAGYREMR
jgi:hypothetical protein